MATKTITVTKKLGKIDPYRSLAVNETASEKGYHQDHVRKVIDGERENDDVKKFYKILYRIHKNAIAQAKEAIGA